MNKSLEELKKIVGGAPDCTEFFGVNYDDEYVPLYQCKGSGGWFWWTGLGWGSTNLGRGDTHIPIEFFHRIIKLEEENQRLRGILVKVMDDYQIVASVAEHEGYLTNYSKLSKIVDSEFEENIGGETS